ncbi:S8 family peptidase [Fusibacter sp. JL298sf-3]
MDGLGHGTHVAGTIAANGNLTGIMHKATVFPVRVFDDYGSSTAYWIIKGIVLAADQGADVINMSFRTLPSKGVEDACNYAVSKGAIPVAVSGNDNWNEIRSPTRYDSVIAVGSVDSKKSRSYFSNYGDGISTTPGNGEDKYSGTSTATPHVTGVVGLMLSVKPDASLKEIREALTSTAEKIDDAKGYGHGLVNSEAAMNALVTS